MPTEESLVLVVDDDVDICETLQMILEGRGYRVVTALNGVEALARLRSGERPFLILLDIMMPRMNGAQFRREQLRDPAIADIPVVVISGDGAALEKAAALGAEGVTKPFDLAVLLETVARRRPAEAPVQY